VVVGLVVLVEEIEHPVSEALILSHQDRAQDGEQETGDREDQF
jgi:hypothetical protein